MYRVTTEGRPTMKRLLLSAPSQKAFLLLLAISQIRYGLSMAQEIKEQAILRGHSHDISCIEFTNDGLALVSGSYDSTVKVWDTQTGQASSTLAGHRNSILAVALTRDGKTLASGSSDQSVKLWNLKTGKELMNLSGI